MALDQRLLRITLEIGDQVRTYENLAMEVQGTKYANANQGECSVSIVNLEKSARDQLETESSPFNANRQQKRIIVESGRESTGYSVVYIGNIFRATSTQPPDQVTTIRCLSGQFQKGRVVANTQPGSSSANTIAQQVADDLGFPLDFQAEDRQIANYSFSGSALNQVDELNKLGDYNAYVDNERLIVKDRGQPLRDLVREIRPQDIIGKPDLTEQGLKLSFFYDTQTRLGSRLDVTSNQYPAVNGRYVIYKLNFHITNRDVPFYYTAEASRNAS